MLNFYTKRPFTWVPILLITFILMQIFWARQIFISYHSFSMYASHTWSLFYMSLPKYAYFNSIFKFFSYTQRILWAFFLYATRYFINSRSPEMLDALWEKIVQNQMNQQSSIWENDQPFAFARMPCYFLRSTLIYTRMLSAICDLRPRLNSTSDLRLHGQEDVRK